MVINLRLIWSRRIASCHPLGNFYKWQNSYFPDIPLFWRANIYIKIDLFRVTQCLTMSKILSSVHCAERFCASEPKWRWGHIQKCGLCSVSLLATLKVFHLHAPDTCGHMWLVAVSNAKQPFCLFSCIKNVKFG